MVRRMNPEPTFDEIEALFHSAVALPSASRAGFIAEHTAGNENLRREELSLVHAFERADSLSGNPPAAVELGIRRTD